MKIELATTDLNNVTNFVVHAENPAEVALLRLFVRRNNADTTLCLHSYGGNVGEGVYSFCFGWRPNA